MKILAAAVLMLVAVDATTRAAGGNQDVAMSDRLAIQPIDGGVYLLGNSMFKTGVDLEAMQAGIVERDVRFNYYDGHYSSLWYLIAKGALGPSEQRPALVVWGFRPHFAGLPAFRQNRPNSTELFEFEDLAYDRLTAGLVAAPLVDAQLLLERWSGVYSQRADFQDYVSQLTDRVGLLALDAVGQQVTGLRDRLIDGDGSIADEVVRAATGGAVQLTEEQVVDGVGDFITGPIRGFAEGFIPLTVTSFADKSLAQLVVIWKPVRVATGDPLPEDDLFVADAIEYFESTGTPYVDLYHEPRLTTEHFASGDHYNAAGRAIVTEILTSRVRTILGLDN